MTEFSGECVECQARHAGKGESSTGHTNVDVVGKGIRGLSAARVTEAAVAAAHLEVCIRKESTWGRYIHYENVSK